MTIQSSAEMRTEIIRWLHALLPVSCADALSAKVDSCERFLRSRSINGIPPAAVPGIIGVPTIDNHLSQWFLEHRPMWLRRQDAETEHNVRDVTGIRPYKGKTTSR
jgi:hypothetical protein